MLPRHFYSEESYTRKKCFGAHWNYTFAQCLFNLSKFKITKNVQKDKEEKNICLFICLQNAETSGFQTKDEEGDMFDKRKVLM